MVLFVLLNCEADPEQAVEYAKRLLELVKTWPNLVVVMRCYPEKPR